MDKFDEKVIGYESAKNILRQILDALKRPELYKSKGASIPQRTSDGIRSRPW